MTAPASPAAATRRPRRSPPRPRAPATRTPLLLLKLAIWAGASLPLLLLIRDAVGDNLGADPFETLTHRTGWWGLTLLLATLAVTPLRRLTGWNPLIKVRRLLGLFAFFYVLLHFGIYLVDQELAWRFISEDVLERPYITAGFSAFVLMIPLALTSTRGMIRRLGRRWQQLHRLVYLVAGLAVLHFLWLVKADTREPLVFAAVLVMLLALRLPYPWRRR